MSTQIDRLLPDIAADLDDEQILSHYAPPSGPWLRANFITSLDGAATRSGKSGGLGDSADLRVFNLLRRLADVILVGAGTVRIEEYGAQWLSAEDESWRLARGMPAQPALALISGSLNLDPKSELFTNAPTRPIIYTLGDTLIDRRRALEAVADVVTVGRTMLDVRALRADLESRGLRQIHSEGGPSTFGSLLEGGVVDELCLTISPTVEAGNAPRIAHSAHSVPTDMELAGILRSGDELFLRMVTKH